MLYPIPKKYIKTSGVKKSAKISYVYFPAELEQVFKIVKSLFKDIRLAPASDGRADIYLKRAEHIAKEGYRISVCADIITLGYSDKAGAFYALITLCQMLAGGDIPCCEIEDAPGLKIRGVMLDISRGKVPTLETLKMAADKLAMLKINHLQLYIEGVSFAYPGYKRLWQDETPLSPEEIKISTAIAASDLLTLRPAKTDSGIWRAGLRKKKFAPLPSVRKASPPWV